MLRNVPLKKIKDHTRKWVSDEEEKEAREVIFITQETHNDEHKSIDTDETDSEGECINDLIEKQKKTNMR